MNFEDKFEFYKDYIDRNLENYLKDEECAENKIYKAMRYSLLSGGKRIRPILMLATGEIFGVNKEELLPFACAIEMIHTYSLIHDDLPCADNDDFRRGKLTNHKVYGEAMAVLAGDALLNSAVELMLSEVINKMPNNYSRLLAMNYIMNASGIKGMIAGQVLDMEYCDSNVSLAMLEYMHSRKTGCLINASVMAGAYLGEAESIQMDSLNKFSKNLGMAFQIKDDILDVVGSREEMGKSVGSDVSNNKSTFVTILGLEKSESILKERTKYAMKHLDIFGNKAEFMLDMARYLLKRTF